MIVKGAGLEALYHKGVKIAEGVKFTVNKFALHAGLSLMELDADPEWVSRLIHRTRGSYPDDLMDVIPRV